MGRRWVVVGVCVAVLAGAGCSDDPSPAELAATTTVDEAATSTTEPCVGDDGTSEELEPLLTGDVPAGYTVASDVAEDAGPVDLELAEFFVGDPYEGPVLAGNGFRRGYQRYFYGPDDGDGGGDLRLHLYEFCSTDGAAGYVRHTRDRLLTPLWGFVAVDVPDLPEPGVALLQESDGGGETFVAVLQAAGRFYIEVGAYDYVPEGLTLDELVARARALVDAQADELP